METERRAEAHEPFLRDSAAEDEFIIDDNETLSNEPTGDRWRRKPSVSTWFELFPNVVRVRT